MSEDCVRKVCVYRGEEASNHYTQIKGLWGIRVTADKSDADHVDWVAQRETEAEELRALPVARIIAAARLLCSRLSTRDDQGGFRKDPEEYAALLNGLMN